MDPSEDDWYNNAIPREEVVPHKKDASKGHDQFEEEVKGEDEYVMQHDEHSAAA